jgi:hypothetical protein
VEQHSVSDAYARCADRREAAQQAYDRLEIRELIDQQKALFTDDTHFAVYLNGEGTEPTEDLHGREALTPVFDALNQYEVTMHFNGQSTVTLEDPDATAESYCIAHHVFTGDGERKIMIAYLRYDDTLRKERGAWRFAERKLYLDFSDTRALGD